jgi:predicted ATPase
MIERFHIQNYKSLRDVDLKLTPVHVLIGPNDSGKTSIFEALATLGRISHGMQLSEAFPGRWRGRDLVWWGDRAGKVSFRTCLRGDGGTIEHVLACEFFEGGKNPRVLDEEVTEQGRSVIQARSTPQSVLRQEDGKPALRRLREEFQGLRLYRWEPSFMRLPVAYEFQTKSGMEPSGFGLAQYLNDILVNDHKRFGDLEQRFQTLFPQVQRIRLHREQGFQDALTRQPSRMGLGIYFEQEGGFLFPATQASDGLILVLAYLALLYSPQPPRLLLIEEPENGVHPRRLQEVIQILRQLLANQEQTQVLLTTHSPYVVDLFRPEEVTLCLKGSDGAVTAHPLSQSKAVLEQMDIFRLGEIWTGEGDEALATPADARVKDPV